CRPMDAGDADPRRAPWLRGGRQRFRGRIPASAGARPAARLRPGRLGRLRYRRSPGPEARRTHLGAARGKVARTAVVDQLELGCPTRVAPDTPVSPRPPLLRIYRPPVRG